MGRLRTIFLVLVWGLCAAARATEFETANRLYDEGRFSEARQRYQALVESGEWSANLFYNLGNANHRMGAPVLAMLNYERALTLDPGHPEATANLRLLREQTNAKLPATTWSDAVFGALSIDRWTLLAAIAGWIAVFCLIVPFILRRAAAPALVFIGVMSLFVTGAAVAAIWHGAPDRNAALIIARQAEARLEPADRATLADVLPAGSRVRIRSEHGPWIYCELPGRGLGWIPAAALERVRISKS
jgi:tetratricopeptide (TPR) repeat protein